MDTNTQVDQPTIEHWSYSSLGLLLRNPLAFKKKYMLHLYDKTMSPSGVVGRACHKAVEHFLNTDCQDAEGAIDAGMQELEQYPDVGIDYGKTGSREKMIASYTTGINFYLEEQPPWHARDIMHIEAGMTQTIHDDEGNELPLPAKCFVDTLWRSTQEETFAGKTYPKGTVFIEDHKFVKSYTDPDDITDPVKLQQAFFNLLVVRETLRGEEPAALLFNEVKLSRNKDGSPQCQYYVIDFEAVRSEMPAFVHLYNDATKYVLNPNALYLPNVSDVFDGKDSWISYRDNLITAEAPKVVHKTSAETQVVEKQYQESASDKVQNRYLDPEEKIRLKLQEFAIPVKMGETYRNSSVVMYTLKPSRGVRMSSIEKHAKDIAIALKAKSIRVQAPIMGTDTVGIEVPNNDRQVIPFFKDGVPVEGAGLEKGTLNIPVGMDVYGKAVTKDLREMPHLLIGGATGAGKSVGLNVILHSLTHQMTPDELKLVLIDPKRVELATFADKPHLLTQVIFEHDRAMRALKWMTEEMEDRYTQLQDRGYRNIIDHNNDRTDKMPYIVVVIDEFADLMLDTRNGFAEWEFCGQHIKHNVRGELSNLFRTKTKLRKKEQLLVEEVEDCAMGGETGNCKKHEYPPAEKMIVRLAQKARAVGIHLIVATQRPSVDVVTGLIKANLPTRIAFMTSSRTDSQIILDQSGAEELVGKGDMLFADPSKKGLQRLQGYYDGESQQQNG